MTLLIALIVSRKNIATPIRAETIISRTVPLWPFGTTPPVHALRSGVVRLISGLVCARIRRLLLRCSGVRVVRGGPQQHAPSDHNYAGPYHKNPRACAFRSYFRNQPLGPPLVCSSNRNSRSSVPPSEPWKPSQYWPVSEPKPGPT